MMIKFNIILIFFVCFFLSIVFHCKSFGFYRHQCSTIRLKHGRVKLRSSGRIARISCNYPFKLVQGNGMMTCVAGKWDNDFPICAIAGCTIDENIAHGSLNILYEGAKLEVNCDTGYEINGPSFVYCTERLIWNEELKGCKEQGNIYLSCDFDSQDEKFCGWTNDIYNVIDWCIDKTTFLIFTSTRHVSPGSSEYFTGNYISLDAGNYGPNTTGRFVSPPIPPIQNVQRCLVFGYKVMSGSSHGIPTLSVTFGGIPHWKTSEGEGKTIIGLYKFNVTSKIIIEGKNCKAAIDNIIIAEGNACAQQPYEEEDNTCHDNCGKIRKDLNCSCDWECYNNNNCCPDIGLKCPYIKSFEDISMLYLTTAATPIHLTTAVQSNISYLTNSNETFSSKIIYQSKVSNNTIIVTTPMNKYQFTIEESINNITQLTFLPKYTRKLITVTMPSTTILTKIPKITTNFNFNSTTLFDYAVLNSTKKSLIINDPTITTNKPVSISNTTTKLINTSRSTIKLPIINSTATSTINMINLTNATTKFLNSSTTHNFTTSTFINNSSSTMKTLVIDFKTFPKKLITHSGITKLIKENTTSIKLLNSSTTMLPFTMKFNDSNTVKQLNITFITKLPIQIIRPNTIPDKIKLITNNSNSAPKNADYLNTTTVLNKKIVIYDTQDLDLTYLKYNSTLKNTKSSDSNNIHPNVTTKYTNHTELKFNTFWKNDEFTTVPNMKPELNYSLHHEQNQNFDQWLTDHMKKNTNSKSADSFNVVNIIKYIATIGVIIIIFKFTLSFIKLYFKKISDNEINTSLIETNEIESCNIELMPSSQIE